MWRKRFLENVVQRVIDEDEEGTRKKRQRAANKRTVDLDLGGRDSGFSTFPFQALSTIVFHEWSAFVSSLPSPLSGPVIPDLRRDEDYDDLIHVHALVAKTPECDAFFAQMEQDVVKELRARMEASSTSLTTEAPSIITAICPVCQHFPPSCYQRHALILCTHCDLHIETGIDGMSLEFLQNLAVVTRGEHDSQCASVPTVEVQAIPGLEQSTMVMTCGTCAYFAIML